MQSFRLPDLSLPSTSMKLLIQSGFFKWLDDTGLKHLVYFFFEGFFKVNGHWPTWSLFQCDVKIDLYVLWQTGKSADTFEYI